MELRSSGVSTGLITGDIFLGWSRDVLRRVVEYYPWQLAVSKLSLFDDLRGDGVIILDEGFSSGISRHFNTLMLYLNLLGLFLRLAADHSLTGVQRRIHIVNHIRSVILDV